MVVNAAARNANRIEMPKRAGKTNAVKLVGICPELSSILAGSHSRATQSNRRLYNGDNSDTAIAGPNPWGCMR